MKCVPQNFDRQTLVQITEDASFERGYVLVSTTRTPCKYFETMVVPWIMGEFLWGVELFQDSDNRSKQARKTHRETCKLFDYMGRDYVFVDGQYIPANS